jgi:hypothetical protein
LLTLLAPAALWAGTKRTVGTQVPATNRISIAQIDHRDWDTLLAKYCDQAGYVDYQAWHASAADRARLTQYLAHLSHADPALRATEASKLAFWINAYNAVTLEGILGEYPTTSIRNHTAKLIGYNLWDDLLLAVGEEAYSLNQIEHDILRKMGEPRIHFAIVCASIGCPPLLNRAYTSDQLESQLTTSAQRFFADPQKFAVGPADTLQLSKIMQWFGKDFGPNQAAQLQRIAPYLPTPAARALATSGQAQVRYLDYDWGLNDQKKRPR